MYKNMIMPTIPTKSMNSHFRGSQITCFSLLKALKRCYSEFYVDFFVEIITFIKNSWDSSFVRTENRKYPCF